MPYLYNNGLQKYIAEKKYVILRNCNTYRTNNQQNNNLHKTQINNCKVKHKHDRKRSLSK